MREPEQPTQSAATSVSAAIASARAAAATSSSSDVAIIEALRKVSLILAEPREPLALALRQQLHDETGLSLPMIEWALVTSLSSLRHAPLEEMVSALPATRPREVIGVVLAGNVFVAALRGLALPLLAGAHVIAKTASAESAFPRAFQAALAAADPGLGARLTIVNFSRDDVAAATAFCKGIDALSVYGSDETVEQLRALSFQGPADARIEPPRSAAMHDSTQAGPAAHSGAAQRIAAAYEATEQAPSQRIPNSTAFPRTPSQAATSGGLAPAARVIPHGHGISAAYVCRSELQSRAQAARTAERVALDIAAYDQHGCLSPHFICVESGGTIEPRAFARLLAAEALPDVAKLLPPAVPTLPEQAEYLQWQATAAIRGELYEHDTHAVSFEQGPARPSPGGRRIGVYACQGHADLRELLSPFAAHLKCLGVAGNKPERAAIAYLLQRFSQASVCRSGEMQTPAFDAWADGAPPFAGLFPSSQT